MSDPKILYIEPAEFGPVFEGNGMTRSDVYVAVGDYLRLVEVRRGFLGLEPTGREVLVEVLDVASSGGLCLRLLGRQHLAVPA